MGCREFSNLLNYLPVGLAGTFNTKMCTLGAIVENLQNTGFSNKEIEVAGQEIESNKIY
jgi:hypothetical protein